MNLLKQTIECCVREKESLSEANLYKANLSEANLSEANLYKANLYKADLYKADLYKTNLSEANLYKADLYKTNLSEANLFGANLFGAYLYKTIGNGNEIKSAQICQWWITWTVATLCIDSHSYLISEWDRFTDEEILKIFPEFLPWWQKNKQLVMMLVKL